MLECKGKVPLVQQQWPFRWFPDPRGAQATTSFIDLLMKDDLDRLVKDFNDEAHI